MPEITASEYLNSLLLAWQSAEKVYGQAVADLVAAEIRRDEAKTSKDEAFNRLEEAREKFGGDKTARSGDRKLNKAHSFRKKNVGKGNSFNKKGPNKVHGFNKPQHHDKVASPPTQKIAQAQAQAQAARNKAKSAPPPDKETAKDNVLQPPNPGSKKAPKIFGGKQSDSAPPKRKSSKIAFGPLVKQGGPLNVLEIAKGRPRDWLGENLDCERLGLVKNFYMASFGTKTNEKTDEFSVCTIVLNDEWNDLVKTTAEVQDMYIGKTTDPDAKPNLLNKAAKALVLPPQREPVALFFDPRSDEGSNDIFYGGHWKVLDGNMLFPPRAVKGQPRQCLAKLQFVGIDNAIVLALNRDP